MVAPTSALLPDEVDLINEFMADNGKMLVMSEPGGPNLDEHHDAAGGSASCPASCSTRSGALAGDPTLVAGQRVPHRVARRQGVDGAQLVTAGGITTAASDDSGLQRGQGDAVQRAVLAGASIPPPRRPFEADKGDRGGPVVLAGAADRSEVKATGETRIPSGGEAIARTRLLVFADADWASNAFLDRLVNARLLANGVNWLAGEEDLVAIGGDDPDLRRLELTSSQRRTMGIGAIGAIPALVLLVGAGVWLRRRRR